MNLDDFPAPKEGFVITHVLVVADPAKGAVFLTEPKDHGPEIRAYRRDPDGHLIEVGQLTGPLD